MLFVGRPGERLIFGKFVSICLAIGCTAALVAGIVLSSMGGAFDSPSGISSNRSDSGSIFDDAGWRDRARPIRQGQLSVEDYLDGEWRLVEIARENAERIVVNDLRQAQGRIVFANAVAGHAQCPQHDFAYRVDEEGRLRKLRREILSNASDCPALPGISYPLDAAPVAWDAMRVLHGDPELSIMGMDLLLLSRGTDILVLRRQPDAPSPIPAR